MKRRTPLLALILLLVSCLRAGAQLVTGTVTDSEYGDPLPGVYIYFTDDKSSIVSTDINGRYRIAARRGDLLFSLVGYDSQVISVDGPQKLDVKLVESAKALSEVEVQRKRQKYSRKNNPAVEMMRKVIAAKKSSDLKERDYFSYKKYEKMTLALNNFTDKVFDDEHFKHFPTLREHVELNPETGKLILPLTLEERVSHQIYRKDPRAEKTIIIGERKEGVTDIINTGDIFTGMMEDVFQDVNIYDDNMRL
ncbi:MAG: carboxypeptidase-like regulatory domain-containing protein, partial [Prevotellaceae bacterium]|nr:carboxypeptidase-like regulatory domain-containing protein [Prevotellaceae bacterium]